jgi:hypothetical protein
MLVPASRLFEFEISAADGEAGRVHDLQVDDRRWAVRDIVVDVGDWFTLIDPAAVWADHARRTLRVAFTAAQIAEGPRIESHPAVVHQHRIGPYNHPGPAPAWGSEGWRPPVFTVLEAVPSKSPPPRRIDPHLRSLRELSHYRLDAHDGEAGRIRDWLVDDRAWLTRYALVRTAGARSSKDVLVPVRWLGPVSYSSRIVRLDLKRDAVIQAPDFVPAALPDADYEMRLLSWYDHPSRRPRSVALG